MDWFHGIVLGIFIVACFFAIYQSRTENWSRVQLIGTGIIFVGAAMGLFLDDLLAGESPLLSWVDPIGAIVLLLVGGLILWFGQRT